MTSQPPHSIQRGGEDHRHPIKSAAGAGGSRLIDVYDSYFKCIPVETDEQREAAFRLRYEVYCVEHPYEDPTQNPGGLESDSYDDQSLHSLLIHRPTDTVVGTVRLITAPKSEAERALPILDVCKHRLLVADTPTLPMVTRGEISRFAISKSMRRRASDDQSSIGGISEPAEDRRRLIPQISLGLMQALLAMSRASGTTHLCAVMEPPLLRMIARLGIHFENLGPLVEYHGMRQPCFADLDTLLAHTWIERRDVWELLTRDGTIWPLNAASVASIVGQSGERTH